MRRFNYTGRRKISRELVRVSLQARPEGDFLFTAAVDLDDLLNDKTVPQGSPVVIEAYGGTKFERFAFGTLGAIESDGPRKLELFTPDERVMFRLKVVDSRGDSGVILAMADKIQPASTEPLNQGSLLYVCVRPLDGVVFKVEIEDGDFPTLVLNSNLDGACAEGIKAYSKGPIFRSLVFPDVVRQILTRYLVIDRISGDVANGDGEDGDREEEDQPAQKWIRFAKSHNPDSVPSVTGGDDCSPIIDWIDRTVGLIGQRNATDKLFEMAVGEAK